MYSRKFGVHGIISAAVACAILGAGALVLNGAHLFSAPIGVVKVGQPSPVETLEEIVVSVNR